MWAHGSTIAEATFLSMEGPASGEHIRMKRFRLLGLGAAGGVLLLARPVLAAETCALPQLGPGVHGQPEAWRDALSDLRRATAQAGEPWSCPGGTLDISTHEGGAILTATTAEGESTSREIETPQDVVPLGEALLARPLPLAPQATDPASAPMVMAPVAPRSAPSKDAAGGGPPHRAERPPRFIVGAMAGPRYAGQSNTLLGSVTASVGVPFGAWVPGAWFRFDGPLASLEEHADPLIELCGGAAFGRMFSVGPVDMTPSVLGSVAVVLPSDDKRGSDDVHVDARFGLEGRLAFPRKSLFRAVITTDAELAPQELGDGSPRGRGDGDGRSQREFPTYTLGLSVGFEVAPR